MTTCTGQLVEFLGSELQSSGPCHIIFLIKLGPNNYLKVSNVDRSESRGFYGHSKLTNFWAFWHFWSFLKSLSSLIEGSGKLIKFFSSLELNSLLIAKKKLKKASLFPEIFDLKVIESKRLYGLKLGFLSMKYRENQGSISLYQLLI